MASRQQLRALQRRINALRERNYQIIEDGIHAPDPITFAECVLGAPLDSWQREFLEHAIIDARVAIAACRQSGKSTIASLFIAWCMLYIENFTVLVASRSLRQAAYFVDKVREWVLTMVPPRAMTVMNRLSLTLPNRSQIISIPCAQPDAGRGFSPQLFLLDEAAFAPDALFTAILPSLAATDGAMHMISSPNGKVGQFFEAFEGHSQDVFWTRRVTHRECPRITERTLINDRIALGDLRFRQEYEAEFVSAEGAFFGAMALDAFESTEAQDLSLLELESILDTTLPRPSPTLDDLSAAFDRAQRVNTEIIR